MLFIFYIIVSISVLEIDGLNVHDKNEPTNHNNLNSSFNDSEIVTESGSVMSKHKSLFYIIQNPSEAPNLKSNIFDKMLSNEMLSMKQQLYEKNESNSSPLYITFRNSLATPTLELKQRWPIDKPFIQSEIKYEKENINKNLQYRSTDDQSDLFTLLIDKKDYDSDNKLNGSVKSKVLGVRSFSGMPVRHLENSSNRQYTTRRQCSCMKTNHRTTCSYQCSEHRKKTCTHVKNFVTEHPQCTRNVMPLTYYPYYAYSTLFLGVPTDPSVIYYHPDVINELKLSNHKHPHNKRPSINKVYFENDDNKNENEYVEYENSVEEKPRKTKYTKNKCEKAKAYRPKNTKMVYFLDYKAGSVMSEEEKLNDGNLQVLDRDKFVEDVVKDLKVYYSDAVIKDCYCSLSSFKFRTEGLIIIMSIFVMLIMYSTFNIDCY